MSTHFNWNQPNYGQLPNKRFQTLRHRPSLPGGPPRKNFHQSPPSRFGPMNALSTVDNIPREVLQLLPSTVKKVYSKYSTSRTTPPTTKPPVIWFPDLTTECEEASPSAPPSGGGFNAFSFLAMVVSITNLVSILASNANNNINNNDNNNNINNDNILDGNEANNNNNLDLFTMVTFAGRKRRDVNLVKDILEVLDEEAVFEPSAEEVVAFVGLQFLRTWYLATRRVPNTFLNYMSTYTNISKIQYQVFDQVHEYSATSQGSKSSSSSTAPRLPEYVSSKSTQAIREPSAGCIKRSLCEANLYSSYLGRLGADVAEVLTAAFVEFLPGWEASPGPLGRAGGRGRLGWNCTDTYQCRDEERNILNAIQEPDLDIMF